MNSVSRRKAFIKLKGPRPKRETDSPADTGRDEDQLVGESRSEAPSRQGTTIGAATFGSSRAGADHATHVVTEDKSFAYLLLWGVVLSLLGALFVATKYYRGQPLVEPGSALAAASESASNERQTTPPRRQIGGDDSGFDRPGQGAASAGAAGDGAAGAGSVDGFRAAPLGSSPHNGSSTIATARQTGLRPGDFRRTTCAVQTSDVNAMSAEKLTQCIEDARVR